MTRLLRFLWTGEWRPAHRHTWEILNSGNLIEDKIQIGTIYHLQCKECGDVALRVLNPTPP